MDAKPIRDRDVSDAAVVVVADGTDRVDDLSAVVSEIGSLLDRVDDLHLLAEALMLLEDAAEWLKFRLGEEDA